MKYTMKNLFFVCLFFAVIICCVGCNQRADDTETEEPIGYIVRYAFSSVEDFKTYCETASKDLSKYKAPPMDNTFPLYKMREGCFVDLLDLFPQLNTNEITVDHVEMASSNYYSYSGYTNKEKTPFSISIYYEEDGEKLKFEEAVKEAKNGEFDTVISSDYHTSASKPTKKTGLCLYIFELEGCVVKYIFFNEKIQGMLVQRGNFKIGISPAYSDNVEFFSDEALTPLSCLFGSGEERKAALKHFADFVDSKMAND